MEPPPADAGNVTTGGDVTNTGTERKVPPLQRVARVIDGDTLELGNGKRVRLVQIDAPEAKGECYGRKAGTVLRQLLPEGTRVRVVRDSRLDNVDRYSRLLRYVFKGKRNINVVLVQKGAASVWFFDGDRGRYTAKLLSAAKRAKVEGRGAWGACEATLDPTSAFDTMQKTNESSDEGAGDGVGGESCAEGYDPCLPIVGDLDCADVEAMGVAPVRVMGSDPYRLDGDDDGYGCE